jgi:hypothetical protein
MPDRVRREQLPRGGVAVVKLAEPAPHGRLEPNVDAIWNRGSDQCLPGWGIASHNVAEGNGVQQQIALSVDY